jgi:hypothetical protein
MALDDPPTPEDADAIFRRTALALAEAFRGLADERKDDPEAAQDMTDAAEAIEKAVAHLA